MKRRWIRWAMGLLGLVLVAVLVLFALYGSGFLERLIRGALVARLEQGTGARVEIGAFRLHLWNLHVEIDDLTLHGLEAPSQPPLFHADRVEARIRIISFLEQKVALDELVIQHPRLAVRTDRGGPSNVPVPRQPARNLPWRTTLFNLSIGRLELEDGSAAYNDARVPLAIAGRDCHFILHYDAPASGPDSYLGSLDLRQVEIAARRDLPFPFNLAVKFTLHRDSFDLDELALTALNSQLHLQAELPSFAQRDWSFRYRGQISLADVRKILRHSSMPDGKADFSGQAQYRSNVSLQGNSGGEWTASGYYFSRNISLPYRFEHEKGIETSGDFTVANQRLFVPDISVQAMGGTVDGQLELVFKGLRFSTKTRLRGASLARLFDALDNDEFPVDSLHWDGVADLDSVNTWNGAFQDFRSTGEMRWSPPSTSEVGTIPVTAQIDYDYRSDREIASISQGEIVTPSTHLAMDGTLGAEDSALEVALTADNLLEWNDFIGAIRGPKTGPHRVAGRLTWRGRVVGPLTEVSFVGHFSATSPQYDDLVWDRLDGDMEYSPDGFLLKNAVVGRGTASSTVNLSLQFAGDWDFLPSSMWRLDARVEHASGDDLQTLLGTPYPITVDLSGHVHGGGTRAAPICDANFVGEHIVVRGWRADPPSCTSVSGPCRRACSIRTSLRR